MRLEKRKESEKSVSVRTASFADLPAIVRLENAMWAPDQRCSRENFIQRLHYFQDGFLVAESNGEIVGTFYGVMRQYKLGQPLNWLRDSGDGTGSTHDPNANGIFGISITVANHAPSGTFRKLIEGWRDLAKRKNVEYIFGASRIPGLCKFSGTPDEYLAKIKERKLFDPVLSKWMACGLKAGSVVPGYFEDPESYDFGVEVYNEFKTS